MASKEGGSSLSSALSRLRFPQLFLLLAFLFLVSLLWPDPLPLVDEAILGLLTLMLSQWKRRPEPISKPPPKNVTPES